MLNYALSEGVVVDSGVSRGKAPAGEPVTSVRERRGRGAGGGRRCGERREGDSGRKSRLRGVRQRGESEGG